MVGGIRYVSKFWWPSLVQKDPSKELMSALKDMGKDMLHDDMNSRWINADTNVVDTDPTRLNFSPCQYIRKTPGWKERYNAKCNFTYTFLSALHSL